MTGASHWQVPGPPWWRLKGGEIVMSTHVADISKAGAALTLFTSFLPSENGGSTETCMAEGLN